MILIVMRATEDDDTDGTEEYDDEDDDTDGSEEDDEEEEDMDENEYNEPTKKRKKKN